MSELKTRFIDDTYVEYYNTGKHELAQIYLKSEADKVIAEKDAEIRRLNHKYWSDKADEAAKMKRLIYGGEIIYLDEYCNEKDWRIMLKVWEDEETKCRAKAEEYK